MSNASKNYNLNHPGKSQVEGLDINESWCDDTPHQNKSQEKFLYQEDIILDSISNDKIDNDSIYFEESQMDDLDITLPLKTNMTTAHQINLVNESLPAFKNSKKTLKSWFESNSIVKPKFDEAVVRKRLLEADEKATSFETKFGRIRKGPHNNSNQDRSPSTPRSPASSLTYVLDTPDTSNSNTSFNSQENVRLAIPPGLSMTPIKSHQKQSLTNRTKKEVSQNSNSIKQPSPLIPSIQTQRQRIQIVRLYDQRNGSANFEVLRATKAGLQCEVCDCTLVDMSSVIRFDASGELKRHCHIGSSSHQAGICIYNLLLYMCIIIK